MKKLLVINNKDSFVYNLIELIRELKIHFDVVNNQDLELAKIENYSAVLISPGGGIPTNYPEMMEVIQMYHSSIPMLGVCLGHQAIAQFFGAKIVQLKNPLHGHKGNLVITNEDQITENIPQNTAIGQYHSWVVNKNDLPHSIKIIAEDKNGNIMILKHHKLPIYGVQFHPESIITSNYGKLIIQNWCKEVGLYHL